MSLPRSIGRGLAEVQHLIDGVCTWGFQQLRRAGKPPKIADMQEKEWLRTVKRGARTAAGAVGAAGEAFYERYGELKKKK